jgi:signal transduction histidine kinase
MAESSAKRWPLILIGVFIVYLAVTLTYFHRIGGPPVVAPPTEQFLVAFADIVQFCLMFLPFVLSARKSAAAHGRARAFWALMAAGFGTWAAAQAGWIFVEVIQKRQIPDPFWADVVLFFHFVPFTAALIVRPHLPGEFRKIALSAIDWTMLLLWWLYMYVFLVFPSQFIHPNQPQYDNSYNTLYLAENLVWLALLAFLFITIRNEWKIIYGQLLAAGTLYIVASRLINVAIQNGAYYTGSIYDVPLVAAALWFVWAIASAPEQTPSRALAYYEDTPEEHAWVPRVAMLALLSIPIMASWLAISDQPHDSIFRFRLLVSMAAIVILGGIVFLKQYLLDRERIRLLTESRQNYVNLQRVQAQLVQSEKLASIGQLVSGAAHEINNPLTAILGYSELMESDPAADDTMRAHATKIKIQALRTKNLVGNLLKFARQSNTEKKLLSLNTVAENALHLRSIEQLGKTVQFNRELDPNLPSVRGDAVQLTDVCLQIIGNAADMLSEKGGFVSVRTYVDKAAVVLEITDNGPGISDPTRVFDPFYTTKALGKGTGLGLSVCYGIIADHKGEIVAENVDGGGARFKVRLPIAQSVTPGTSQPAKSAQEN